MVVIQKGFNYLLNTEAQTTTDVENEIAASNNEENLNRWLNTLSQNTQQMVTLCRQAGITVILVGRAEKQEGKEGFASENAIRINNALMKFASPPVSYFSSCDKFTAFHPYPTNKDLLFTDGTHWTEKGHHLIARELWAHLQNITPTD
jgi:lysophospholipase L1-like esterase